MQLKRCMDNDSLHILFFLDLSDHYLCRDGTMLKDEYVLDGVEDCDDGTDELANSPLCGRWRELGI